MPFRDTPVGLAITSISPEQMAETGPDFGVQLTQYHVALPIEVRKSAVNGLSEMINRLNSLSPIPGWSFDRTENIIHYRYVACAHGDTLHKGQVTYIMQLIMFYMNTYVPLMEELISGKAKFSDVIARAEKAMQAAA